MPNSHRTALDHLQRVLAEQSAEATCARLSPRHGTLPPRVPGASLISADAIDRRWKALKNAPATVRAALWPGTDAVTADVYGKNIENFIGKISVPVGVAGPLRVNGLSAQNDYYVPLATTEAALVASYHRGSLVISESGGCAAVTMAEGVSRSPGWAFENLAQAGSFVAWVSERFETLRAEAESTTCHGKLVDLRVAMEGNHVYVVFDYLTGDAAGQNMVTIATQKACDYIATHSPIRAKYHFVEANLSGDKKASMQSFQSVRGKKVCAEVRIPRTVISKRLHTTAREMENYWRMSAIGGVMSGTIGVQGHYANGIAALYLACGQDVACVSESAVGITRFEAGDDGSLYATVTLPNVVVGTVGGGTGLPSQAACLDLLGLRGAGCGRAFGELVSAVALAGEISIIAALCSQQFTSAHQRLARTGADKTP
jgi:hydroxymethylglutaryl-CoA reductase (NADPH)